ncbi:MAG: DUF2712 domain-containing protein [Acutalibacteraceae bacterium]
MKKRAIKTLISCAIVSIIMASLSIPAFAYVDDSYGYNFYIQPYLANTYWNDVKFRETYDNQNAWKVQLAYSEEGNGTITRFWIEKANTGKSSPASEYYLIKQGGTVYYKPATNAGDHTNVKLAAENNNNVPRGYQVSGVWDEETGKRPN